MAHSRRSFLKLLTVGAIGTALYRVVEVPKQAQVFYSYYHNLWVMLRVRGEAINAKFQYGVFVTKDPDVAAALRASSSFKGKEGDCYGKAIYEAREPATMNPKDVYTFDGQGRMRKRIL